MRQDGVKMKRRLRMRHYPESPVPSPKIMRAFFSTKLLLTIRKTISLIPSPGCPVIRSTRATPIPSASNPERPPRGDDPFCAGKYFWPAMFRVIQSRERVGFRLVHRTAKAGGTRYRVNEHPELNSQRNTSISCSACDNIIYGSDVVGEGFVLGPATKRKRCPAGGKRVGSSRFRGWLQRSCRIRAPPYRVSYLTNTRYWELRKTPPRHIPESNAMAMELLRLDALWEPG